MDDDSMVKIQATISGYSGKPCSLLSVYYRDSGILAIAKIHAYTEESVKEASIITNVPRIKRDAFFTESDLKTAIQCFKTMSARVLPDGSSGIEMSASVGRANPAHTLESNGIDVSGEKFKIAPDVTNEQIAVLATCFFVDRIETRDNDIALINGLNEAYDKLVMGWTVTI